MSKNDMTLTPQGLHRIRTRQLKMTLRELGDAIGYSHSTLGLYENGKRTITRRVTMLVRQVVAARKQRT